MRYTAPSQRTFPVLPLVEEVVRLARFEYTRIFGRGGGDGYVV